MPYLPSISAASSRAWLRALTRPTRPQPHRNQSPANLPLDSPTDGVKVSASGSVDVKDESGAAVLALDLDITIQ